MDIFQKLTPQVVITPVLEFIYKTFTIKIPNDELDTQVKANKKARSDMLLRHASFSLLSIYN